MLVQSHVALYQRTWESKSGLPYGLKPILLVPDAASPKGLGVQAERPVEFVTQSTLRHVLLVPCPPALALIIPEPASCACFGHLGVSTCRHPSASLQPGALKANPPPLQRGIRGGEATPRVPGTGTMGCSTVYLGLPSRPSSGGPR